MEPLSAAAAGMSVAGDRLATVASNVAAGSFNPAVAVQSELQLSANVQADAAIVATEKTMLGVLLDLKI